MNDDELPLALARPYQHKGVTFNPHSREVIACPYCRRRHWHLHSGRKVAHCRSARGREYLVVTADELRTVIDQRTST